MYGKTYYSFYSWYIDKEYTHNYYYGLYNFFKNINNWYINMYSQPAEIKNKKRNYIIAGVDAYDYSNNFILFDIDIIKNFTIRGVYKFINREYKELEPYETGSLYVSDFKENYYFFTVSYRPAKHIILGNSIGYNRNQANIIERTNLYRFWIWIGGYFEFQYEEKNVIDNFEVLIDNYAWGDTWFKFGYEIEKRNMRTYNFWKEKSYYNNIEKYEYRERCEILPNNYRNDIVSYSIGVDIKKIIPEITIYYEYINYPNDIIYVDTVYGYTKYEKYKNRYKNRLGIEVGIPIIEELGINLYSSWENDKKLDLDSNYINEERDIYESGIGIEFKNSNDINILKKINISEIQCGIYYKNEIEKNKILEHKIGLLGDIMLWNKIGVQEEMYIKEQDNEVQWLCYTLLIYKITL